MSDSQRRPDTAMRRRLLVGGAAASAGVVLMGDKAFGQTASGTPGSLADFIAWQESVLDAAERAGTLGAPERELVELIRSINAVALAGPPPTTTTTSTTTTTTVVAPPAMTTTTAGPQAIDVARWIADGEHFGNGFTVPAGETWAFVPGAHVTTAGNVVVQGTLRMHQPDPGAQQRLTFVDVDTRRFVGGDTHSVQETDVGLWLVDDGRLDLRGAPKAAWSRLTGAADRGARTIEVADASGWVPGDEVVVTPTAERSVREYWRAWDRRVITAVTGNLVALDAPLTHAHPVVEGTWTAEVLNLSRSVLIEGSPGREAHIMSVHQGMHASRSPVGHVLSHVQLRHLGPSRRDSAGRELGVPGRYALHLHHGQETTNGMVVEGVVAHDCRNHCFVAHGSNGVTFRDCITHDTLETPYWWDPGDVSDRVAYERCVASGASIDGGQERFKLAGFFAARTSQRLTSAMRGCVATAIGGPDAAGYFWDNGSAGVWTFEDCVAHNIDINGIRVWQNSSQVHPIDRFTAYRCGTGIEHGAYSNGYQYHRPRLHDCAIGARITAVTRTDDGVARQEWHDLEVTNCPLPLHVIDAAVDPSGPTDFRRCSVGRVVVEATHTTQAKHWDFTDCGLAPDDFEVRSRAGRFLLRTQDGGSAWRLESSGDWQPTAPY
jgi:hypothetical protein